MSLGIQIAPSFVVMKETDLNVDIDTMNSIKVILFIRDMLVTQNRDCSECCASKYSNLIRKIALSVDFSTQNIMW